MQDIYWPDGKLSHRGVIHLITDMNLVPIPNKGILRDGRAVEFINGRWTLKEG